MNRKIRIFILLFITGIWLTMSCEDTECISFNTRNVVIQFLDSANNDKEISIDYISATGTDVIFISDTTFSTCILPVNTHENQTTFLFTSTSKTDTLQLGYKQYQKLISEKCGFDLRFADLTVLYTTFPDAVVVEKELSRLVLNDLQRRNIEIYN